MSAVVIQGNITGYDGKQLTIAAPLADEYLLVKRNIRECEIRLTDGRAISANQRKAIYATLRDISLWTGYVPDETKAIMKYDFIYEWYIFLLFSFSCFLMYTQSNS